MKTLAESAQLDHLRIGGKAANLGLLFRAGFLVPDAIILHQSDTDVSDVEINQFLAAMIAEGYESVAVRSSANLEDGKVTSFAGMFETYLNVIGLNNVKEAVQKCIHSSQSARVEQYCNKNRIKKEDLSISIIIQAMIRGEVSGVAFTVDPMNGNDTSIMIEAVSGTGDRLVQGEVNPERFHYDWFQESVLIDEPREKPLLSNSQIKELGELALKIQLHFSCPQDIEWTYLKGKFYILQSRPLTKINFKVDADWTNANMKDGGVASSVANPFIISLYKMMMNQTMPTYFKSIKMLSKKSSLDWVEVYCSNLYWNLSAVKNCVNKVPGYVERELDFGIGVEPNYIGDGERSSLTFKTAIKAVQVLLALKKSLANRPKLSQEVLDYSEKVFQDYDHADFSKLTDKDLSIKALELIDKHWFAIEGGYFYHIYDNSNARTLFMKDFDRYAKKTKVNYLNLVTALDDIPHLDPMNELWEIAQKIYPDESMRVRFTSVTAETLAKSYLNDSQFAFRALFEQYIQKYRFHSYRELDLLVPCWGEDPEQVFDALVGMLKGDGISRNQAHFHKQKEVYLAERKKVTSPILLRSLDQHRHLLKMREHLRVESARCFYLIRKTFLEVGKRLQSRGLLTNSSDVFFISYQEACADLSGDINPKLSSLIRKQKDYYQSFINFEKPNEIWSSQTELSILDADENQTLLGVGCSTGVVEGKVCIIEGIQQMHQLDRDSILVTRFIDPAWPVFLLEVKGIITEAGGILSHGAIISREYGIPAVLSAPRATQVLKTGMRVRLNGETGTITIMDSNEKR